MSISTQRSGLPPAAGAWARTENLPPAFELAVGFWSSISSANWNGMLAVVKVSLIVTAFCFVSS